LIIERKNQLQYFRIGLKVVEYKMLSEYPFRDNLSPFAKPSLHYIKLVLIITFIHKHLVYRYN